MQPDDFARTLARRARISHAAARDRVDEAVYKILKSLRKGEAVKLPGLGKLIPPARAKGR